MGPHGLPVASINQMFSTAAAFIVMQWLMCGWIFTTVVLYNLWKSTFYWIPLVIIGWTIWDRDIINRGGRRFRPLRRLRIFRLWREYFPVTLIKTKELAPDANYLFGYHPHGWIGVGSMVSFMTEALDVSATFPGLRFTQLTTRLAYAIPIFRDFMLALGASNASEENIRHIAQTSNGNAIVLVVGGAAETLDARPGLARLVLKDRKGFARTALKTGCHLVPVYGFGENNIFHPLLKNPLGSRTRKIQRWIQVKTGVPLGVHCYGPCKLFGWLPFSHPIHVVVGRPITVEKNINPSEEEISALHETYKEGLKELFDEHKDKYGYGGQELEFI